MKRAVFIVALLFVALATPPSQASDVEEQLKQLEHKWMNAVRAQDISTIERILAPEYTLTVAVEGEPLEVLPRADYISSCRGYYVIHSFEFKEFLIRVYGDVAVVNSRYTQKATLGGKYDRSAEFFLSDTWIKRNGEWQVAARYSSRPEKP